jgi:hypothetical protein
MQTDAQRIQCSQKQTKLNSVGQKFVSTVWGNFSQGAGTLGTLRDIAFSQLAVKGLNSIKTLLQSHSRAVLVTSGPTKNDPPPPPPTHTPHPPKWHTLTTRFTALISVVVLSVPSRIR